MGKKWDVSSTRAVAEICVLSGWSIAREMTRNAVSAAENRPAYPGVMSVKKWAGEGDVQKQGGC